MINDYIRNKLSLKINLVMSNGKKRKGVATEELIDGLMKGVDGLGKYLIEYKGNCPTALLDLDRSYRSEYNNGYYTLYYPDDTFKVRIEAKKYIEFTLSDYRNWQLRKLGING